MKFTKWENMRDHILNLNLSNNNNNADDDSLSWVTNFLSPNKMSPGSFKYVFFPVTPKNVPKFVNIRYDKV